MILGRVKGCRWGYGNQPKGFHLNKENYLISDWLLFF